MKKQRLEGTIEALERHDQEKNPYTIIILAGGEGSRLFAPSDTGYLATLKVGDPAIFVVSREKPWTHAKRPAYKSGQLYCLEIYHKDGNLLETSTSMSPRQFEKRKEHPTAEPTGIFDYKGFVIRRSEYGNEFTYRDVMTTITERGNISINIEGTDKEGTTDKNYWPNHLTQTLLSIIIPTATQQEHNIVVLPETGENRTGQVKSVEEVVVSMRNTDINMKGLLQGYQTQAIPLTKKLPIPKTRDERLYQLGTIIFLKHAIETGYPLHDLDRILHNLILHFTTLTDTEQPYGTGVLPQ